MKCFEILLPSHYYFPHSLAFRVIGSGPAGMAFAYTAATIGHHVTLFDKSNEIGGQFNMAKRVPGKEEVRLSFMIYSMVPAPTVYLQINIFYDSWFFSSTKLLDISGHSSAS